MVVFTAVYYSFSPYAAAMIHGSDTLKQAMKILLYPLIGILQVSYGAFQLLSFNPELGIAVAGMIASALIGVVYLTPVVLLFYKVRRLRLKNHIPALSILWAGSGIAMALGEVMAVSGLMMASTATFVLANTCLATLATVEMWSDLIS